ncbi:putative T7SS-secreted protein [Streptomyces sp. NPDC095613]|uniref:putative T7SS-secreted protein n=1 Tax=Streptomyces sp. NPDC095613 TaxID=3155540 RepID=UPI00331FFFA6
MGIGDFVPDVVEDAVESGVEWAGNRVEDAGRWTADRLDDVGWQSGADWVREQSGSLANRMGAEVDELDLGQTEDKTKLIYGSPSKIRSTASHLRDFQEAFNQVGEGLRGLESDSLKGEGADAFRETVSIEPPKWFKAADACEDAAAALESFADTVEWAQGEAQTAIDKWKAGTRASEEARDAYNDRVDSYNQAADRYNALPADEREPSCRPQKPGEFSDPGTARMEEAQDILAEARRQRNSAAETARAAVTAARDTAPPKPSYSEQLQDGLEEIPVMVDHVEGGIIRGTAGMLTFVRSVNPTDPYNLTHPAEYVTSLNSTATGLLTVANDPWGAGRQMVGDFMRDPSEGVGRLIPDLALTVATGGAGAGVKATRLAADAADLASDAQRARRALDNDPPGAHDPPNGRRETGGTDPVDLASGRMFLPQTDVVLPGALPLVFTRRVESGYAVGRFFGPSWSSTVDERLEIDANGVVHVTDDGRLLAYPHPVPGLYTLPETGTVRRTLARDEAGDYTVTDPDTGLVRYFTAPPGAEPGGDGDAWLVQISDRNGHTINVDRAADGTPLALVHSAGYRLVLTVAEGRVIGLALASASASAGTGDSRTDASGASGGPLGDDARGNRRVGHRVDGNRTHESRPDTGRPDGSGTDDSLAPGTAPAPDHTDSDDGRRTVQPLVSYGYTDGNLTTVTKASGSTLTFEYDDRRRVTAWVDSNQRRYDYVYDDLHRVIAEGGEAGHFQVSLTYSEPDPATGHRTTTLTTADGHTTRHLIGDGCRVLATTDALGYTTRFTYDRRGKLLARTEALGHTTAFTYDKAGRVTAVTRPDGSQLRTRRNALGLTTEFIGPDGARWRQEFDERGNRTSVTDPAGHATHYAYDTYGRLVSVTDALGAVSTVRCDPAGLPLEITDPLGGTTRYERDVFGRPVRLTDPLGAVTHLEWTADGELARRTGPDGATESWTYDGEGNCTSHTDAVGQVSRFEYTHFDLMAARTDPDGARYEFSHDAELRLTQVTNPQGLTWSYTYDPAGRLISETDFDGRTLTYTLDPAGRLAARTTPLGETVAYEHDPLGQMIRKDAAGEVTTYAYDPAGRLLRAAGPDSELVYQYDRRGSVKTELADGRATTYAYDELGRRTRRVTPTGRVTTYGYDAAGRPTHLTTGGHRIEFTRDVAGRELERAFGDILTLSSTWDDAGRLATQQLSTGARTLNTRAYTYRADGHLTALDDSLRGAQRFALDPVGRVTEVTAADWSETYAYDEAGNQTTATWPARYAGGDAMGERVYTGTRVRRAGANRYEHDAAGRLVLRTKTRLSKKPDTWRYTYNADNQLTAVTTPDGTRWRYRYDPLGRRTAKERLAADGVTVAERTTFTWDGTVLAEQTTTDAGQLPHPVTLTWDHQGLTPLVQTERLTDETTQREIDARFFAIATDLVGTPTELIDESGDIAWHTRTTLWGTTTWARTSTAYTPLRFPGQYFDPETGLHYNYFRYYDPETARYTTPDPLGLTPAPNPTTYVDNPRTWIDPLGLAPEAGCPPTHVVGKGDDPLVPELVDEINARYPGHVRAQGIEIMGPDGKPLTDFDIVTDNAVIQVKTGSGKGALKQALTTQSLTDYPVIVYLPEGRGSVIKSLEQAGFMVTRDKETLLDVLAP